MGTRSVWLSLDYLPNPKNKKKRSNIVFTRLRYKKRWNMSMHNKLVYIVYDNKIKKKYLLFKRQQRKRITIFSSRISVRTSQIVNLHITIYFVLFYWATLFVFVIFCLLKLFLYLRKETDWNRLTIQEHNLKNMLSQILSVFRSRAYDHSNQ